MPDAEVADGGLACALVLDPADTIWYGGISEIPESTWDLEGDPQGGVPTTFPAYVEPVFDFWAFKDIVTGLDSLPVEDGAAYY